MFDVDVDGGSDMFRFLDTIKYYEKTKSFQNNNDNSKINIITYFLSINTQV